MYMPFIPGAFLLETHTKEIIIATSKEELRQLPSILFLEHYNTLSTVLSTLHTFFI